MGAKTATANRLRGLHDDSPPDRNNGSRDVVSAQQLLQRQTNLEQQMQKVLTAVEKLQTPPAPQATPTKPEPPTAAPPQQPAPGQKDRQQKMRQFFD